MSDRVTLYKQYARLKKVPAAIVAPLHVRLLWAMGVEAKPSIVYGSPVPATIGLAFKIALLFMLTGMFAVSPSVKEFFYNVRHFPVVMIFCAILVAMPAAYMIVRMHRTNLGTDCWDIIANSDLVVKQNRTPPIPRWCKVVMGASFAAPLVAMTLLKPSPDYVFKVAVSLSFGVIGIILAVQRHKNPQTCVLVPKGNTI